MTGMSATAGPGHSPTPGDPDVSEPSDGTPDGTGALAAAHNDARQRAETGDLTGARSLLEDALAAGEVRLGHDHPRLAPLMVDLATIARGLGNLTEALSQLRRAYAIIAAAGGPEHATALSIEGRLAAVMYRLGEPTEAYDWHLADVGARVLGSEHPAIKGARQRIANTPIHPITPAEPYQPPAPEETPSWLPGEPGLAPTFTTDPQAGGDGPPSQEETLYAQTSPGVYQRQPRATGEVRRPEPGPSVYVVPPPPRDYEPVPARPEPPAPIRARRRGHGGGVALVGGLGAAAMVAAAIFGFQLFHPPGPTEPGPVGTASAAPSTANTTPAPSGVNLVDGGGSVTVTWFDPSGGRVPFIVAGGREDTPSSPLDSVPVGRTSSTIYGLNINFDYCFTVAAVWSSEVISTSVRACTHRLSTTGPA
jgi:hypothetical protein